jgi:integrase
VTFPVTIKYRQSKVKIYAPGKSFPYYRLCFTAAGKRQIQTFATYSAAKDAGEKKAEQLHNDSAGASLTPRQSQDALAAFERLATLYQTTGRKFSLIGVVSEFADCIVKLHGRSLGEAVTGFMRTEVNVKAKDVAQAVEDFIAGREHKTQAKDGKRAQLSESYAVHVNSWLREFAGTFPGTSVCDLSKEHLNIYAETMKDFTPKTRNHRRNTVKMFLKWCVRQDYLPVSHRLFESDGLAVEVAETQETDFFRPSELKKLLGHADAELRPVIAIAGLAGLRGEEIMRLEWADVWRAEGHIEVSAQNAKTRQRRLVEICPALAAWLKDYRKKEGKVYPRGVHAFQHAFLKLRKDQKIADRRNGLRHAFCTYHFAEHANENLTAAQAGNSPAMIHGHYKGLATKAEAGKWFATLPKKTAGSPASTVSA